MNPELVQSLKTDIDMLRVVAQSISNKVSRKDRNLAITLAAGQLMLAFDAVATVMIGWSEVPADRDPKKPMLLYTGFTTHEAFQRHNNDLPLSTTLNELHRMLEVHILEHVESLQNSRGGVAGNHYTFNRGDKK